MKKARKEINMAEKIANERDANFAEEAFVVDVQILLHKIMEEKGFSRADLARSLNVSRARISQIFSDECKNLTVRLLARAMHAMGETPELMCELQLDEIRRKWERESRKLAKAATNVVPMWDDETDINDVCAPANDNRLVGLANLARHFRMEVAA
jgi:plasmid maintenance system antidote protein VapI